MAIAWPREITRDYQGLGKVGNFWSQGIVLKVSYVLLHQVDLVLTVLATNLGLCELNPLMRELLTTPLQLVVVKLFIPLLLAWLIPGKLLIPAVIFISLVVVWNVKELLLLLL